MLQVGHLERFNAAILAAYPYFTQPRFIECHRLAPFKERGTDVNVVLDLMIHDIDIVQTIVGSPIVSIDAIGTPVFSDEIDIANARIHFESGCVANATASRVSLKTERKLRVIQDDAYLSIDLHQKSLTLMRRLPARSTPGAAARHDRGADVRAGGCAQSRDRVVPRLYPHRQAARRGRGGGHAGSGDRHAHYRARATGVSGSMNGG